MLIFYNEYISVSENTVLSIKFNIKLSHTVKSTSLFIKFYKNITNKMVIFLVKGCFNISKLAMFYHFKKNFTLFNIARPFFEVHFEDFGKELFFLQCI